jgi:hypothetical protein
MNFVRKKRGASLATARVHLGRARVDEVTIFGTEMS